jgi:ABC-type branched-subunit amino acid transport system substrate-binding protein
MEALRMAIEHGLVAVAALSLVGCLSPPVEPPSDGVHVGVLLPYTGALATIGQNLERAVVMANERLAAAEHDPGKPPFRLIFRDTHSDDRKGMAAVTDLMDAERVSFILGPEEPSLASSMATALRDRAVAISGGAVSLDAQGQTTWFRIVPTARRMSAALASRMKADGMRTLAIIYVPDAYGMTFSTQFAAEFKAAAGGVVQTTVALNADLPSGEAVRRAQAGKPDAILLVAYPPGGAAVIQEWAVLAASERWYFAPSLRSEVFAQNVPPGLIDGMVGVTAGLSADARNFEKEFSQRWRGELPASNAHYYYDAMILAGLAHRAASARTGSPMPPAAELARALIAVSGPGGRVQSWQEVDSALSLVESGTDIDYRGTSGTVDFSPDGSVPQGHILFWTIHNGGLETL